MSSFMDFWMSCVLRYGTEVGTKHEEQVIRPTRELKQEKTEASKKWEKQAE